MKALQFIQLGTLALQVLIFLAIWQLSRAWRRAFKAQNTRIELLEKKK